MIFQHTHEWVTGTSPHTGLPKTQTRRAVKEGEVLYHGDVGRPIYSHPGGLCGVDAGARFCTRKTYALQPGRGKHAVGRIEITTIRYCERADDISPEDAIAEGFATPEQFRETYAKINGAAALEQACWALSFRPIEGTKQ